MSLMSQLQRRFGRFAVPNLTVILIAGQALVFLAGAVTVAPGRARLLDNVGLLPEKVLQGDVWRLVTFLFDPPGMHPIFLFFAWYLFYLMGTTLEATWGAFRYNAYLAIGWLASVAASFVFWFVVGLPGVAASNAFLYGTVFLAFARLYPDFVIQLFFILPVKIKWLAWLTWAGYAWTLLFSGGWMPRMMVIAAVANYLLFFGRDIWRDMKQGQRRMSHQARALRTPGRIVHKCRVCGLTSDESPQTQFRYCSKCDGQCCYCPEHLNNHEHVQSKEPAESRVER
jgi:hypothetical protein